MSSSRIALVLLSFAPIVVGQVPPPPTVAGKEAKKPRLSIPQRTVELGEVLEGDKRTVTWRIDNVGTADLVIDKTRASCGCTVVKLSDEQKTIPPGGQLEFQAEFDSHRRWGAQSKVVTIETNDPLEPSTQVEFKAEVVKTYELSPTNLNLRMIRRGVANERVATVTPESGRKSVEVVKIEFDNPAPLTYTTSPFVAPNGGTAQKISFVVTENASLGPLIADAQITLNVDGLERQTELPIRGEIVADLTWTPKVVDATRQASVRGQQLAPLALRSTDAKPFGITASKAGPLLDVSITPEPTSPRAEFEVTLRVRDDAPPGPFAATLQIRTTLPDQPIIEIPVFGMVAPRMEIEPPAIVLIADGTPAGTKRRIRLQTLPSDHWKVLGVRSDTPDVVAKLDEVASERLPHISFLDVTLANPPASGKHEHSLTLKTSSSNMPEVVIPVYIDVP